MANQDVRATVRLMRKQPIFTAAVLVMLALGIGATTAIFSVVYGVLLKPLPFPEPDRIVQVYGSVPSRSITDDVADRGELLGSPRSESRRSRRSARLHGASFTLTGFDQPERVSGAIVSVGFFRALGVQTRGRPAVRARRRRSRRAADARARCRTASGRAASAPTGRSSAGRSTSTAAPTTSSACCRPGTHVAGCRRRVRAVHPPAERESRELGVRRDRPSQAGRDDRGRVSTISDASSRDLEARYPDEQGPDGTLVRPSRTGSRAISLRRTLWILLGAVGLLLVIACVNVTNLLLARASTRVRESAVRTALGATRADLIRERLTESLMLSGAGAVLGWLVAVALVTVLKSLDPGGIPRLAEVQLNGWVLAFAAAADLRRRHLSRGWFRRCRRRSRTSSRRCARASAASVGDRAHDRVRKIFVGAEVALSLVLLVGAGLLVRSLTQVLAADRGFETDHRLLATVSIPGAYPEDRRAQIVTDLLSRLEGAAGIAARRRRERPAAVARQHRHGHRVRATGRPSPTPTCRGRAGAS